MSQKDEHLVNYVVSELGRQQHLDEIIKGVAQSAGMDWYTAKRFVLKVKEEHKKEIARQGAPVMFAISLGMVAAGVLIAFSMVVQTLRGVIIIFLSLPIPWLGNVVYFLTGVFMVIGGLIGLAQTAKRSI